jgi:hypothetical protein
MHWQAFILLSLVSVNAADPLFTIPRTDGSGPLTFCDATQQARIKGEFAAAAFMADKASDGVGDSKFTQLLNALWRNDAGNGNIKSLIPYISSKERDKTD